MKNIDIRLKDHNDPFSQGFCSFFMQNFAIFHDLDNGGYNGKDGLIRGEKIVISDNQKCDIGLMNVDTDICPPEAKIVFCNAKSDYGSNEFFFPYLQNARNESLQMDFFEERTKYEKKYHCIAIFNSHTHPIRSQIILRLNEVCDVVIVDGKIIKPQNEEFYGICDQWDIMKHSKFCICPPGHVNETYRFYEALRCHCIPLEFNSHCKRLEGFSGDYVVSASDLARIAELKYSEEELNRVQANIRRETLLRYLVGKISSHNIG